LTVTLIKSLLSITLPCLTCSNPRMLLDAAGKEAVSMVSHDYTSDLLTSHLLLLVCVSNFTYSYIDEPSDRELDVIADFLTDIKEVDVSKRRM
jgi:hypothetical protein